MVHIDGVPEIMFQMDPIDIDGWDVYVPKRMCRKLVYKFTRDMVEYKNIRENAEIEVQNITNHLLKHFQ